MPMGAAIGNLGGSLISAFTAKSVGDSQAKAAKKAGGVAAAGNLEAAKIASKAALKAARIQAKGGRSALKDIRRFGKKAVGAQEDYYDEAVSYLEPYRTVGQGAVYSLADLYGLPTAANPEGGQPLSDEALAAFERSPDYQFALEQGIKARDRSAAAKGMLLSGGAERELAEFSSGLASQNFGNYFNRLLQLSQLGETAAGSSANAALTTGRGVGETYLDMGRGLASGRAGIADAKAGGITNAGNALASGVLGAANAYANALTGAAEAQGAGTVGFANNLGAGITGAFNNLAFDNYLSGGGVKSGSATLY